MLTSLSPPARRTVDRLLERLLELPPGERRAALPRMCDDPALRESVLRLLRAAEATDSPLDPDSAISRRLWTRLAAVADERETLMTAGAVVGPYRILEEIERGGMGVVYRAERIDGEFTREVAVKILKLGVDTEEVVRRFEQERQILADLDHPNIAALLDAGHSEDGRPYFVMELVEGQPIDQYCQERQLSVEARLKLFLRVCDAVEYAHRNLVVHRDLKPANVLVSSAAGRGPTNLPPEPDECGDYRVKLLDFGIARLLEPDSGKAAAPATRAGLRVMTPEYASPEQVRGERVTTASDVYQLGLLLYELLTGHRPYSLRDRSTSEIERVICEQAPTRPSTVAARLRWRLRGDLDNIVGKALAKEPARRYRSADRLAEDIRRHLRGLPVTARPDTWFYRSRKFVRRHAVASAAVTVMVVMTTIITGVYLTHLQEAYRQAETQRVQAQAERDRAQAVTAFMNDLFGNANSLASRGNEVTVREMLDQGAEALRIREDLSPALKGSMMLAMGRAYNSLGLGRQAVPLLKSAQSLLIDHVGPAEQIGILVSLTTAYSDHGQFDAVIATVDEAMALMRSTGVASGDDMTYLKIHGLDSQLTLMADPLEQTTAGLRGIVADLESRVEAPSDRLLLQAYMALSYAYALQDADDQSVAIAQRANEIANRLYGDGDMRMLQYHFYHGSGMRRVDPEQAVSILQPLAADYQRLLGPGLPLASTLNSLSLALAQLGRTDEAMAASRRVVAMAREFGGERDRAYLNATNHLATFHRRAGQPAEAEAMLLAILPTLEARATSGGGMDRILHANALSILAATSTDQDRLETAERRYTQADRVLASTDPGAWPRIRSEILEGLAASRLELGRHEAAREVLDRLEKLHRQRNFDSEDESLQRVAALRNKLGG